MTFNIRYGTAPDKENAWPHRRNLVFEVIRSANSDIIGLQEAQSFQIDELLTEFPRYASLGVDRAADGSGEYSAILYDKSRYDVKQADTFWLSDTPDVSGSHTWGNELPRICTWAQLYDRKLKRSICVFNTHWDHVSQPSRERSAMLIRDRINARSQNDSPVLVIGDFNIGAGNPAWKTLLAANLSDSFTHLHPNAQEIGTFHAFSGQTSLDKIDAIFVSPHWQVEAAEIIRTHKDGRYPSDHFPVTATLMLTSEEDPARR